MKRGWRNDPAWVAYYEKRDRERMDRYSGIVQFEKQWAKQESRLDEKACVFPLPSRNTRL